MFDFIKIKPILLGLCLSASSVFASDDEQFEREVDFILEKTGVSSESSGDEYLPAVPVVCSESDEEVKAPKQRPSIKDHLISCRVCCRKHVRGVCEGKRFKSSLRNLHAKHLKQRNLRLAARRNMSAAAAATQPAAASAFPCAAAAQSPSADVVPCVVDGGLDSPKDIASVNSAEGVEAVLELVKGLGFDEPALMELELAIKTGGVVHNVTRELGMALIAVLESHVFEVTWAYHLNDDNPGFQMLYIGHKCVR